MSDNKLHMFVLVQYIVTRLLKMYFSHIGVQFKKSNLYNTKCIKGLKFHVQVLFHHNSILLNI